MANKKLQGKRFPIPNDIQTHLKNVLSGFDGSSRSKGFSRLTELVDEPTITYEQLKRIKNLFDYINIEDDFDEYRLNGGEVMKNWVNKTLDDSRKRIEDDKEIRTNGGMINQYKKSFNKGTKTLDRDYLIDKIKMNETLERILKIMKHNTL